jgi:hypothetical protein
MTYTPKLDISDEKWHSYRKGQWQKINLRFLEDEWDEHYRVYKKFYMTGNVHQLIEDALAENLLPGMYYRDIFSSNPSRKMSTIKENLSIFWSWILEDPAERMPNKIGGGAIPLKETLESAFRKTIDALGLPHSNFDDPVIEAEMFTEVFGKTFEANRTVVFQLGDTRLELAIEVDPNDMFFRLLNKLNNYLFDDEYRMKSYSILEVIDYWFSLFPHITEHRIFDTFLYEYEDEDEVMFLGCDLYRAQWAIRTFFGQMLGYNIYYEEQEELLHNDVDFEQYVREKLAQIDMPENFHKLILFIHKHKHECLDESEL